MQSHSDSGIRRSQVSGDLPSIHFASRIQLILQRQMRARPAGEEAAQLKMSVGAAERS